MAMVINSSKVLVNFSKMLTKQLPIAMESRRLYSVSPDPLPTRLANKVAVITASTAGIGLCAAERLLQEGAKVVISSRKQDNVNEALDSLKQKGWKDVIGIKCHVSSAEERKSLFNAALDNFGRIDVLVSNAAVNPGFGPILDCSEEIWDKIFDVNVKSSYLLAKEVIPILRRQKSGGSIIFMSSYVGLNPMPVIGAYSVSKTALSGLTKVLSQDLGAENIRVNCIAPGTIMTKFGSPMFDTEEIRDAMMSIISMRRLGEPKDIAGVIAFLASEDASYITGETIIVAGGAPSRL